MAMSRYKQRAVLNHVMKGTAYTQPTNLYIALFTTMPTDTTNGVEVSGGGYARQICNSWSAASDASPSDSSNGTLVDWGTAGSAWGTIVGFGIYDALTGLTNLLDYSDSFTSKVVASGDPVTAPIGSLHVTLN